MSDIFKIYDRNLYKIGVPLYSDDLSTYQVVSSSEGRINPDQINSGTTVEQQQQYLGALIAGKLDFTNDDNGYILGIDKGVPKFYIGNSEDYLNWNGTELILSGTISASAGIIGGFTITEDSLYATTTGAIKTSATVGAGSDGVIIDKDGLKMYDSILGIVVNFPSDGSAPTFSSGTINSTAFNINTNAAIRTSETVGDGTSDSYGILINNTGLYACQANQTLANANVKILIDGSVSITGTINANAGKIGSSTNYWSIGAKGITATSSNGDVIINYGKTDFGSATSGFILGYDYSSSKAKFELGDATNYLNWNGSTLSISGSISATSGTIGGFTISANALYAGTGVTRIQLDTSQGIFLGANTLATSPFSVTLSGALSATSGTIGGCALAETSIGSTLFVSGPLGSGWNISNTGIAEFQNATVRGIIRTSVFEKDTISAVNGMMLISSADVLDSDMTSLDNSTLTIKGETTFVANEVIRIKDGTDDEWMLVTNAASAPVYTVTRDLAGSYSANTNPVWKKGTAVVSMGVGTGDKTGFILLDSSSADSPYIDIYGRNSNTYSDYTLHGRFGWLKGITNADVGLATTDVWGLYTDNAYIKGVIVADSGKIGGTSGWSISAGSISSVNGGNTTTMASGGTNAYIAGTTGSPEFIVTHTGALTASSAVITGAITTGAGSSISADYLTTGTITSKTITLAVSAGTGDTYIAAGKTDFTNIDAGFILGLDDSDDDKAKFYIGNINQYMNWTGSSLDLYGVGLVAGTIKTSTSGQRIEITPSGFYGYDSSNRQSSIITGNGLLTLSNYTQDSGIYLKNCHINSNNAYDGMIIQKRPLITDGSVYSDYGAVAGFVSWDPIMAGNATKTGTGTIIIVNGAISTGIGEGGSYDFVGINKGTSAKSYKIEIDGVGSPNTFKWSDDGGTSWVATGVAITESSQTLTSIDSSRVTLKFSATTGGDLGDYWVFTSGAYSTIDLVFKKILKLGSSGPTFWVSNGTTPNGNLSGGTGDVCFYGDSGKVYYCTGTTNWTAM